MRNECVVRLMEGLVKDTKANQNVTKVMKKVNLTPTFNDRKIMKYKPPGLCPMYRKSFCNKTKPFVSSFSITGNLTG
jgi:hypothetical protein